MQDSSKIIFRLNTGHLWTQDIFILSFPGKKTVPLLRKNRSLVFFKVVFWNYSRFVQCVLVSHKPASKKYRLLLLRYISGAWNLIANFKEHGSINHL